MVGVDYAKEDCKIPAFKPAGKSEATCNQERTESYNRFELERKTQGFQCDGVVPGIPRKHNRKLDWLLI
jgi:hypothetical protein